jgi:hypothetical protein
MCWTFKKKIGKVVLDNKPSSKMQHKRRRGRFEAGDWVDFVLDSDS